MSALPPNLEQTRNATLAALGDIKPAGPPQGDDEAHALMMASRTQGGREAEPYFEWLAEQVAGGSKLNVTNNSDWLFERYEYLRDEHKRLEDEFERRKDERNITGYPDGGLVSAWPAYAIRRHAGWTGQAAIDAFFSWTEHAFIHIAILNGVLRTGDEVAALAEGDWKAKFKAALPIDDAAMKRRYEVLLDLRAQIRNYMAHGAFGKRGQAFRFHSGAGAVPVLLTRRQQHRYTLSGNPSFGEKAALKEIDDFIRYLYTTDVAIALEHVQSGLASNLTYAADGTYSRAMNTMENMKEFIEYMSHQVDRSANMDW